MLLYEMLGRTSKEYPDNKAVIWNGTVLTYSEFEKQTICIASWLQHNGVRKGDSVALLMPNCTPFLASYYAITRIGAVAVPANPLLKPAELEYIWRDSRVKMIITTPPLLKGVQSVLETIPGIQSVVVVNSQEELPVGYTSWDEVSTFPATQLHNENLSEHDCAVIIYTSGTTGRPKGAMLSHKNLTRNVEQVFAAIKFSSQDTILTVLPLFHSYAATVCMNLALASGMTTVLMESFIPGKVLELIKNYRITVFPAVPAMFQALMAQPESAFPETASIRVLISGGAPLPVALIEPLERRFGAPVLEGDGPTECSPVTSLNPLHGTRKPGSVGIPLPGVDIAIWDDNCDEMPVNQLGEIVVRGDNVMLGYLNQPEATEEAMAGGWYHTGDIGLIDEDGYLFILDRKKDMIITAGLNVYPREVEEQLRSHPAVQDVAVIGVPDRLRGESVTAVVVLREGCSVSERDLILHCRATLADYKSPRSVIFRTSLPIGGTGKVLKRLLKKEMEMEASM